MKNIAKLEVGLIEVCRIIDFEKGFSFGPHSHSRLEINYVIRGKVLLHVAGDLASYKSGDCMVIFPNAVHTFVAKNKTQILQIEFLENVFPELEENMSQQEEDIPFFIRIINRSASYAKFTDALNVYSCLTHIYREMQEKKEYYEPLLGIYFSELAYLISRRLKEQKDMLNNVPANPLVNKAAQYLVNNFTEDISLEKLAEEMAVSSRYLRTLFLKYLGMKPSSFLIHLRIDNAKELIIKEAHNISEIAYLSGFNSPQYFCKAFLDATGLTPSEYKKQLFRKH
jgi:AraC-like DNA-binding protein